MAEQNGTSPLLEIEDDRLVDTLVRIVNGPEHGFREAKREEVLRLQAEFTPLVIMARAAPAELYEQEFDARLRELHDGGVTLGIGSELLRNGQRRQVYTRHFRDIHALLSQALLLLMDSIGPHGKALCRCKLPSCGRFYIARKNPNGGPANRTYCNPTHRAEHHDSAGRKAAKRAARHK